MPRMRMNQAIGAAIADEMRRDDSVILFGEDVAAAGGVFKTTEGLWRNSARFGFATRPSQKWGSSVPQSELLQRGFDPSLRSCS